MTGAGQFTHMSAHALRVVGVRAATPSALLIFLRRRVLPSAAREPSSVTSSEVASFAELSRCGHRSLTHAERSALPRVVTLTCIAPAGADRGQNAPARPPNAIRRACAKAPSWRPAILRASAQSKEPLNRSPQLLPVWRCRRVRQVTRAAKVDQRPLACYHGGSGSRPGCAAGRSAA